MTSHSTFPSQKWHKTENAIKITMSVATQRESENERRKKKIKQLHQQ